MGGVCAEDFLPEEIMRCCIQSCSEEAGASLLVGRAGDRQTGKVVNQEDGMGRRGLREGRSGCVGGHSRLVWQPMRLPGGVSA